MPTKEKTKKKAPETLGTVESPHRFPQGAWVTEAVEDWLTEHPEGIYEWWSVSSHSPEFGDVGWEPSGAYQTKEAAEKAVASAYRSDRKGWIEWQQHKWARETAAAQTKQIVTFTLRKKTSKKKIAEWAAQMEEQVKVLRGKTALKMPKFEPVVGVDVAEYKIERVTVTLRKELVVENG